LPRQLNPAIPKAVERVTLQALVKQPDGRFPTAGAMVEALQQSRPNWARPPLAVWDKIAPRLQAGIGPRRLALLAVVVAVAVIGLGLGLWGLQRHRQQQANVRQAEEMAALTALIGTGERHLAAGEWEPALAACQEALDLDPDNGPAQDCVALSA
jgi:uncharacterized protein HemX